VFRRVGNIAKRRLLALSSVWLPVRPFVRMEQLGLHWIDFHENSYWELRLLMVCENPQNGLLRFHEKNGYAKHHSVKLCIDWLICSVFANIRYKIFIVRKAVWFLPSVKHRAVTGRSITRNICTSIVQTLLRNSSVMIFQKFSTVQHYYFVSYKMELQRRIT
jgi:hypothetical protein